MKTADERGAVISDERMVDEGASHVGASRQRLGRVSIFLPSLAGGGAERSIVAVANGLAAKGHHVTLVLGRREGPYLAEVSERVAIFDLGVASMPLALLSLVRHLKTARPDALLAAMSHANVVAAMAHRLARVHCRLVLSEHVNHSAFLEWHGNLRQRITHRLMLWTYPHADSVVGVSEGVANDLLLNFPLQRDRVVVIYNPVVSSQLIGLSKLPASHPWLAEPVSRDAPVVVAAGRLIEQKDFGTLLKAFSILRRTLRARLVILGEGHLRDLLSKQAVELGIQADLDLPGFEANPFAAMRAASIFVLSSSFEGLGLVLIEAMACGTRVVSTDCPSGPREILENGRWGRLVPVGDADALAAAMAAALNDPMPPDVRLRAQTFSVERAVQRYAEVLGLA